MASRHSNERSLRDFPGGGLTHGLHHLLQQLHITHEQSQDSCSEPLSCRVHHPIPHHHHLLLYHHPQTSKQQDDQKHQTLQSHDGARRCFLHLLASLPRVHRARAEQRSPRPQPFTVGTQDRRFYGCSEQLPQPGAVRFHGQRLQAEVQELRALKDGERDGG